MNAMDRAILLIKSLDSDAHLRFSEVTHKWYVSARIDVSDGVLSRRITEHRDSPEETILAYLDNLTTVSHGEIVVTNGPAGRRHWRWNGAAFTEEPVDWFKTCSKHVPLPHAQKEG